jgi:hypothetical protein
MVYSVPTELRFESDLASYYESLGIGSVESVVICRKWTRLRMAVERRQYYLKKLEGVYARITSRAKRMPIYRRRRASDNVNERTELLGIDEDSTLGRIRIDDFRESDGTDACVFEVMSRLDVVDPAIRPKIKTGLFGLFGASVDAAEFYSQQFKIWDKTVDTLRRFHPEHSAATGIYSGFLIVKRLPL